MLAPVIGCLIGIAAFFIITGMAGNAIRNLVKHRRTTIPCAVLLSAVATLAAASANITVVPCHENNAVATTEPAAPCYCE